MDTAAVVNFREMDIYPTQTEMLGFLTHHMQKNIIEGAFQNVEQYLDIHFKLLREDFVASLREAIAKHLSGDEECNIDIYNNVNIFTSVKNSIKIKLESKVDLQNMENSKKFLNGSLLIFTKDNFTTTFFAKVTRRDEADFKANEIIIEFVKEKRVGYDFTMAECRCFFEPYYQVLRVLKKLTEDIFPMKKYIIQASTLTSLPKYLSSDLSRTYKVDDQLLCLNDWSKFPTKITGLNDAQAIAFKAALSEEFVVIQGPPGTGKTYLGLKIAETLLKNHHLWYNKSPILVISHKNNAVDQFLEGLLPFTKRLVRVGRQSQSEALKKYNLTKERKILNPISAASILEMLQELLNEEKRSDLEILQDALVIGMTTTAAARMKETLEVIGSPIVIVEEAAEVLEAHVVAALSTKCQHLILLGDHLQLQPSTASRDIGKNYHLGISLFERMVNNGINCYQLNVQHRMRPEISDILKMTVYPFLKDHASVHGKPPVLGVDENVFFIDHRQPEEIANVTSKKNHHEAMFVVELARYLILNGYKSSDIVILATYAGQVRELKRQVRRLPDKEWLHNVTISTLDSFQGQEAEIILLSLVRSEGIGFLAADTRVCVAMSRAKNGFYIVGNMDLFATESKMFRTINQCLTQQQAIGRDLTLRSQKHPELVTKVKYAADFKKIPMGCCNNMCYEKLSCGHICRWHCHVLDHKEYKCKEPCERKICNIHKGERCSNKCFEDCDECMVLVWKTFKCGHRIFTTCSTEKCTKHDDS